MYNSTRKTFRNIFSVIVIASFATAPLALAHDEHGKDKLDAAAEKTVTGEIVDMMCYVDHNAVGEEHGKTCGAKCIMNGGRVGHVDRGKVCFVGGGAETLYNGRADSCGEKITTKVIHSAHADAAIPISTTDTIARTA